MKTLKLLIPICVLLLCESCSRKADEEPYIYAGEGAKSLNPQEDIIGKWSLIANAYSGDNDYIERRQDYVIWEFKSGGTCKHTFDGFSSECSYTIDGDILYKKGINQEGIEYSMSGLDGYKIRFFDNGDIMKLVTVTFEFNECTTDENGITRCNLLYPVNIIILKRTK